MSLPPRAWGETQGWGGPEVSCSGLEELARHRSGQPCLAGLLACSWGGLLEGVSAEGARPEPLSE